MALVDIVRNAGVAVASKVFESMKVDVTHRAWTGDDGRGTDTFADPVSRRALVDLTSKVIYTGSGALAVTLASLTFLDAIEDTAPTAGKDRLNPLDPRDIITLPDGRTAPIVQTGGFVDSGTGQPFLQETILGNVVRGG